MRGIGRRDDVCILLKHERRVARRVGCEALLYHAHNRLYSHLCPHYTQLSSHLLRQEPEGIARSRECAGPSVVLLQTPTQRRMHAHVEGCRLVGDVISR